jgi:hypothetical protein
MRNRHNITNWRAPNSFTVSAFCPTEIYFKLYDLCITSPKSRLSGTQTTLKPHLKWLDIWEVRLLGELWLNVVKAIQQHIIKMLIERPNTRSDMFSVVGHWWAGIYDWFSRLCRPGINLMWPFNMLIQCFSARICTATKMTLKSQKIKVSNRLDIRKLRRICYLKTLPAMAFHMLTQIWSETTTNIAYSTSYHGRTYWITDL